MILIAGASGVVGTPTIRALLARGHQVRALSSNAESAAKLRASGVSEVVIGDLRSDQDVDRAMHGVDQVVHIPPNIVEDEHEIGYRMVAAAGRAGVDHFVFVSCFHPHPSDIPSHHNKLLVEDAIYKSDLNYTVLQPSMFMQNLALVWDQVEKADTLAWPWSEHRPLALIDTSDLGDAVACVVGQRRFFGGTFEVSSGSELTIVQMAEILGRTRGKPVTASRIDSAAWSAGMAAHGVPKWTIDNIVAMTHFYDRYGYRGGSGVVFEAITGRRTTSYEEFAANFVKERAQAVPS